MKNLISISWVVGLSLFFYQSSKKSDEYSRKFTTTLSAPPLTELDTKTIKLLTFGHQGLYDDYINIWLLQTLSDKSLKDFPVEDVASAIQQVTRHRPKIEVIYMAACFTLAMDLHRPDLCEPIIMDGLHAFPQSWRLPMTQGFVLSNLLKQNAQAAGFYQMAASRKTSPPYVGRLAKKLIQKKGITTAEFKKAFDLMMKVPGGSHFAKFLETNFKARQTRP